MSRDQAGRRNHHGRVEVYVGNHISPWGFGAELWFVQKVKSKSIERETSTKKNDATQELSSFGWTKIKMWVDGHISP
jgi:hypothetical protein